MIVCSCNIISDHDIRGAVVATDDELLSAAQVYDCLDAPSGAGDARNRYAGFSMSGRRVARNIENVCTCNGKHILSDTCIVRRCASRRRAEVID